MCSLRETHEQGRRDVGVGRQALELSLRCYTKPLPMPTTGLVENSC
jgi:hypothetical protein